MMCGEAAGIAASQAIEAGVAVQRIDPAAYRKALLASGMLIAWDESLRIPTKTDTRSVAQAFMKVADDDHDGKISLQEWETHKPGWDWLFPKIDLNGDGFLDLSEYEAFHHYKEDHQDWRELLKK